jgi:integrase
VLRKDGNAEIRRSFEKDVLPTLGRQAVRTVTEHDLRSVLRAVVARGVNRMAVNLSRDIKQMFDWAEKRQPWRRLLQEGNPTNLIEIERIVAADYDMSNIRTRVLSPAEIRELKAIFERTQAAYDSAPDKRKATRPVQAETQLALWICLSTCCRIGELLMTQWRHVDRNAATWFIPKDNVKGARGKQQDQLVFLSAFALEQFQALHRLSGETDWCFPARGAENHVCVKSVSKQIGDRQLRFKNRKDLSNRRNDDSLVLARGANGEWTPHDLRRTAATMMQALGVSPDVIDRCQNHVLAGSRVRRHYLKHEYKDEKREAWRLLGAEIERLLKDSGAESTAVSGATRVGDRRAGTIRVDSSLANW